MVISNLTGIPLQLAELHSSSSAGGPRAQQQQGTLPAGAASGGPDPASILDLPTGGAGIPLHWSLGADMRAVRLRFAPEAPNEAGPSWSHPVDLDKALSATSRFVSLPVRLPAAKVGRTVHPASLHVTIIHGPCTHLNTLAK